LEDSVLLGNRNGERSSMSLKDLDGDGLLDAVTGNYAGGINYYSGIFPTSLDALKEDASPFLVFPNPGSTLNVRSMQEVVDQVDVFDIQGRIIHTEKGNALPTLSIDAHAWAKGLYIIRVTGKKHAGSFRWIRQ
jgi:hypothetical protein